jgi:hypothetical protein
MSLAGKKSREELRAQHIQQTVRTVQTRQAMYTCRNIEAHSYKHCCSGKAISIIYSEYVPVALLIQHAMR